MDLNNLVQGYVVETKAETWTGELFYSDKIIHDEHHSVAFQPLLNELSRVPVVGIAAGITRMALAVIHSIGHLFVAVLTLDKGHCYHAVKGGCEFLRGAIEATPFLGREFANSYYEEGLWWMLKIYNPNRPDSLDYHTGKWSHLKEVRPGGYIVA